MFGLLAQLADQQSPTDFPPPEQISFWQIISHWLLGWQGWLYFALLVWMILYCLKNDPDRFIWLWVMLLFQPFGAVVYFFVRWLPSSDVRWPSFMHRWTRRSHIRRLSIAAQQIGNAHQFIQLGDALRDVGRATEAGEAYLKALDKEADSLPALWGAASVEFQQHQFIDAKEKLAAILKVDPAYKFGDVSLLYGKTLASLQENQAARSHLQQHTSKWRQPEGLFLLAQLSMNAGDIPAARQHLESLIVDIDSSPPAIARNYLFWKSRAKRMLRRIKP